MRELNALQHDREGLAAIAGDALRDLRHKLPQVLGDDEALRLDAPDVLADLLREVQDELLARLAAGGATP